MDLKQRLARLDRLTRRVDAPGSGAAGAGAPLAAPKSGPQAAAARAERLTADLAALGLTPLEGRQGTVWFRDLQDDVPVPERPAPDFTGFFPRDGRLRPGPGNLLFLDAETTGLAGGTGTLAFLVGISWWERGRLRTRQLFLPDPGHEPALLEELGRAASGRRVVVTFNGTVFDLPLLRTRALLNRVDDPLAGLGGWDLLVASRRLWGRSCADCRQQTLEGEICGLRRGPGDIEGSRIPQAWFDFLAGNGDGALGRVLTHNRRDMVGMAELLLCVWRRAEAISADDRAPAVDRWQEAWSLARICEVRGQAQDACAWTAAALDLREGPSRRTAEDPAVLQRFWRDALRVGKRAGRHALVQRILEEALDRLPQAAWLHREAAILYEHRLHRLDKALEHAFCSGEEGRVARIRAKRLREAGTPDRPGQPQPRTGPWPPAEEEPWRD